MVITRQAEDQHRKADHEAEHAEAENSDAHGERDSRGKVDCHAKSAAKGDGFIDGILSSN
jgi:hypothetical protein